MNSCFQKTTHINAMKNIINVSFTVMFCYYVQSTETEESVCYLPSAHTCTNTLVLPRGPLLAKLPTEDEMFEIFYLAFSNSHFGKV